MDKKKKTYMYHVGAMKGSGVVGDHKPTTLILQFVKDKDFLSPDLWKYLGHKKFHKTKSFIRDNPFEKTMLLIGFNETYATNFTSIVIV